MKSSQRLLIVLVTAPSLKVARGLAKAALKERLVACANLVLGLESHYWWKGKIERSKEVLLFLKTSQAKVSALEQLIVARHPYDTPEFVVVAPAAINRKFQAWWQAALK
jgi:periplasmic divalent cation tolerance protein